MRRQSPGEIGFLRCSLLTGTRSRCRVVAEFCVSGYHAITGGPRYKRDAEGNVPAIVWRLACSESHCHCGHTDSCRARGID